MSRLHGGYKILKFYVGYATNIKFDIPHNNINFREIILNQFGCPQSGSLTIDDFGKSKSFDT